MNMAPVGSSQVPGSAPGQAEPCLSPHYKGGGAGHRATSGFTVRTEACESEIRHPDWHHWVPGETGLTVDYGQVGTAVGSQG